MLDPGLTVLLDRVLPDRTQSLNPSSLLYLDVSAIGTPGLALTTAARETLHIGDIVETTLRRDWNRNQSGK